MNPAPPGAKREITLFVYDDWMSDRPGAARLSAARSLGPAATAPGFDLVDLGNAVSLVPGGTTSVRGELYVLDAAHLASLDVEKGHPLRFKRVRIPLQDGRQAEAYTLDPDQARGRRRIRSGDYRAHVAPAAPVRQSNWSRWARTRGGAGG